MYKHETAIKLLKVARGQIESAIKMTEDDRYCLDISTQINATISLLKKAQVGILSKHIHTCVIESIQKGNPEEKIDEIETLIKKII